MKAISKCSQYGYEFYLILKQTRESLLGIRTNNSLADATLATS
jgi:hypothetical protein